MDFITEVKEAMIARLPQIIMIGSGSMESACKQIGFERLKIAGARWSADRARRLAKARASYLSGVWHNLFPYHHTLPQAA